MAQPFSPGDGPPTFYFNIEAYSAYRTAAADFIKTNLGGKDPLNPTAMLINEIVEAEKVHEFRTTGRVTNASGEVIFTGDREDVAAQRRAHRGTRDKAGAADRVSTDAEGVFRAAAKLPPRAVKTDTFIGGFKRWPDGVSEADGALHVAVMTSTGRQEIVIYHGPDGAFLRLDTERGASRRFWDEWQERERRRRERAAGR